MSTLLKKWYFWLALVIAILFFWQYLSNFSYTRNLYNQLLDNLRTDQSKIVKTLEDNQEAYKKELLRLRDENLAIQKALASVRVEKESIRRERDELQKKREDIVVSDNPDDLVNELHKLGYKSAYRRKGRSAR